MKKKMCPFTTEQQDCSEGCALYFKGPSNNKGCVFLHIHSALFSINESIMDISHSLEEIRHEKIEG